MNEAARLPPVARQRLQQTLAQWRHWQGAQKPGYRPEVVEILSDGNSNFSIRVAAQKHFVVRIDGVNPAQLGLNRQAEYRALQLANAAGIAPCPRYFNPELGSLVCDYLPPDAAAQASPQALAALLRRIHSLPALHYRLDLRERLLRYEKQLANREQSPLQALQALRSPVMEALHRTELEASARVLCHNDLLPANRLFSGGQLWIIDWEYSAMGDAWFDLAMVSLDDNLDDDSTAAFLHAYLGRDPGTQDLLRLHWQRCIYRYLELLWYLTAKPEKLQPPQLRERIDGLQRELERHPGG